jgi:hypothetical protein
MWSAPELCNLEKVLTEEVVAITARRKKVGLPPPDDDLVGIALSGGGIRSATICLGVLEVLNGNGLLEKADYLSSVSGGGYTASYIHATLSKYASERAAFDSLFGKDIARIRERGSYLAQNLFGYFKLAGAFVFSFFMNLVWVLALFVAIGSIASCCVQEFNYFISWFYPEVLLGAAILFFAWHFFLHGLRPYCWSSRILYAVEGIIIILSFPYAAHQIFSAFAHAHGLFTCILMKCPCTVPVGNLLDKLLVNPHCWTTTLGFLVILAFIGFFANPNMLTFHRFYRDSLARAYLNLIRGVDSANSILERQRVIGGWLPIPW